MTKKKVEHRHIAHKSNREANYHDKYNLKTIPVLIVDSVVVQKIAFDFHH